jgi:hypothetical protein
VEHDPVFTFGLRQREFETEGEKLRKLGADVIKVTSAIYNHTSVIIIFTYFPSARFVEEG